MDPERPCCKPSWSEALKLMNDSKFLTMLLEFNKVGCGVKLTIKITKSKFSLRNTMKSHTFILYFDLTQHYDFCLIPEKKRKFLGHHHWGNC